MSESSQTNDLRNRILFTVFILAIYRLGTFIPLPGIDPEQLQIMMQSNQKGLLGMFNVFAGGAVSRMAIFALGIMPYISSSIIIQLLTGTSDYFKNLKAQGEMGRQKITQITRYGTVLLATIQGYGLSVGLESSANLVINPGIFFKISTCTTIVAGTIFLMWLGEQITQRGIGNGISLIIFSGIVAEIPGLDKKQLTVEVEEGVLTIAGDKHGSFEDEGAKVLRRELKQSSFKRSFELGELLDGDNIAANFKDGILSISIPKSEPEKPKRTYVKIA